MSSQKQAAPSYYIASQAEDEIDLVALFRTVWQDKWALLVTVALCLLASLVYLWTTPKRYQVSAKLYPIDTVQMATVAPGNGGKGLGYGVDIQDSGVFYRSTLDGLNSLTYQQHFWVNQAGLSHETPLGGELLDDFLDFRRSLRLAVPEVDNKPAVVSIEGSDPVAIADHLLGFLNYLSAEVAAKSLSRLLQAIDVSVERIDQAILQARTKANAEISDRIVSVTEALEIASALGIEDPEFNRLANIEVTLFNSRQYLLGKKALASELQALEQRRNKDAFVQGLRELEVARASLLADRERISRYIAGFRPVVYPESISPPLKPIGPNKAMTLIIAVVLGVVFGIAVAFIRHGMRSYQRTDKSGLPAQN